MNSRTCFHLLRRLGRGAALGFLLAFLLLGPPAALDAPQEAQRSSSAGPALPPPSASLPGASPAGDPPPDGPPEEGDELAQTHWISIDGRRPASYQEWRAAQPPPAPLRVERVYASPALAAGDASAPLVCALVNPRLYDQVAASLARWAADVEREGWSVVMYSASFPDPPAMRAHLASIAGLRGCLLIGDWPIPWYKWIDPDPPFGTKDLPFDLYYMDLDSTWEDDDGDGLYEDHTGDIGLEIWIGRLTAGNLTFGRDEAALVNNYFSKNHAYRTGDLALPARGLVYVDDPWAWASNVAYLGDAMSVLYPERTVVSEMAETCVEDYARRLTDDYAWIHLITHSTAYGHFFTEHEGDTTYTRVLYNKDIYDIDPHALFYNFFACGVGRFTEPDYIAGWYVFADTYGLAAWGSTSSGGMARDFEILHGLLAQGEPLGAAHLGWYERTENTQKTRGFHYGLTIFGDPTLTVDTTNTPGRAPATLTLAGPCPDGSSGCVGIGLAQPFTATVEPPTATLPLRYTWQVTDKAPTTHVGARQDVLSLAWTAPGQKTVAVTATNHAGTVTATLTLTVHAPDLGLAPRALSETLVLGTALTRALTLSNGGPGDLGFRLLETDHLLSAGVGPDPFGYTYLDSVQPHGPAYRWIEIAPPAGGSGTYVDLPTVWQGGYAWPIPLPFAFPFYGQEYDKLAIGSRGTLSFVDQVIGRENQPLPSARAPEVETLIAPFWDFLVIDPGAVYYQDMGSIFVVEYYQVSRYGGADGTFEAILYDNGNMLFQYQDMDFSYYWGNRGQSATVGIQGDAVTGLQYSYNEPSLSDGLAICFAYPGQLPDCSTPVEAPWLSVGPSGGLVPPGGERSVDLVLDARAPGVTGPGLYQANLVALTNDLQESLVCVPVTMTVLTPTYGLSLFPLADARSGRLGESVSYTLHLTNTANTWDGFELAVSGAAWPVVVPALVGPLAPGQGAVIAGTVGVPPTAASGATDTAAIHITSQGDSDQRGTALWTTTAEVPPLPQRDLFLPLIARSSAR